jgi:hypothetical protein
VSSGTGTPACAPFLAAPVQDRQEPDLAKATIQAISIFFMLVELPASNKTVARSDHKPATNLRLAPMKFKTHFPNPAK